MKNITISIANRVYDITLQEPFEDIMKDDIQNSFDLNKDNDVKVLLSAYLEKSFENYKLKQEIADILDKLP